MVWHKPPVNFIVTAEVKQILKMRYSTRPKKYWLALYFAIVIGVAVHGVGMPATD